jgi:hypothetical protein
VKPICPPLSVVDIITIFTNEYGIYSTRRTVISKTAKCPHKITLFKNFPFRKYFRIFVRSQKFLVILVNSSQKLQFLRNIGIFLTSENPKVHLFKTH